MEKEVENLSNWSFWAWPKITKNWTKCTGRYFYEVNCNEADRDFRLENNMSYKNTDIAFFETSFMTTKNLHMCVSFSLFWLLLVNGLCHLPKSGDYDKVLTVEGRVSPKICPHSNHQNPQVCCLAKGTFQV